MTTYVYICLYINHMFPDPFQCPTDLVYLNLYNSEKRRDIEKRQIAFFLGIKWSFV